LLNGNKKYLQLVDEFKDLFDSNIVTIKGLNRRYREN
jgi:hypothetical protein